MYADVPLKKLLTQYRPNNDAPVGLLCVDSAVRLCNVDNTPSTRYNRLWNRLCNRFHNRVERTATVRSTRFSNRVVQPVWQPVWQPAVYTIQPDVNWQPLWEQVVSCKRVL